MDHLLQLFLGYFERPITCAVVITVLCIPLMPLCFRRTRPMHTALLLLAAVSLFGQPRIPLHDLFVEPLVPVWPAGTKVIYGVLGSRIGDDITVTGGAEEFYIERYEDGRWAELSGEGHGAVFNQLAWGARPGRLCAFKVCRYFPDGIAPGRYRISKPISEVYREGQGGGILLATGQTAYCYFTVA